TSTFDAIPCRQGLTITAEQPSRFGVVDPGPCGPKDRSQLRFCVARWNVDDKVGNLAIRYSLQMGADRRYVDAINELSGWLQDWPGLYHELPQAAPCFLRLQPLQMKVRLAEEVFQVVRVRYR